MEKMPLTIGMAVYNEEKHIAEAVESLLAQTYKDFTLLIVDNASTDRTEEICRNYAHKDKRIVYLKNERNMGAFFSFCRILENTNTPFFVLCGGHDRWDPRFVEKLLPSVGKDNIILSCSKIKKISLDGKKIESLENNEDHDTTSIENPAKRFAHLLTFPNLGYSFCGIWLTETLKKCNLNFASYGSDVILLQQASLEGKFKQNKEVLVWFRENREPEIHDETIKRQLHSVYKKQQNTFLAGLFYVWENMKIPFGRRYSFGAITKLRLAMDVIYYKFFKWYVPTSLKMILIKFVGRKNYFKLKLFLKSR